MFIYIAGSDELAKQAFRKHFVDNSDYSSGTQLRFKFDFAPTDPLGFNTRNGCEFRLSSEDDDPTKIHDLNKVIYVFCDLSSALAIEATQSQLSELRRRFPSDPMVLVNTMEDSRKISDSACILNSNSKLTYNLQLPTNTSARNYAAAIVKGFGILTEHFHIISELPERRTSLAARVNNYIGDFEKARKTTTCSQESLISSFTSLFKPAKPTALYTPDDVIIAATELLMVLKGNRNDFTRLNEQQLIALHQEPELAKLNESAVALLDDFELLRYNEKALWTRAP